MPVLAENLSCQCSSCLSILYYLEFRTSSSNQHVIPGSPNHEILTSSESGPFHPLRIGECRSDVVDQL